MRALLFSCFICLPLKCLLLTSSYGYRNHPLSGQYRLHNGVDLRARRDTVFAVMDGTTEYSGFDAALGWHIRLDHDSVTTIYGHLSQIFIFPGEPVLCGQAIGITGATGRVTGEHLHFSVRRSGRCINPLEFIYQSIINNKNHE